MAGEVLQNIEERDGLIEILLHCTADDSDASYPVTLIEWTIDGFLLKMTTTPGDIAPDAYDVELEDEGGVDVLGGAGANGDILDSAVVYPKDPAGTIMQSGVGILGGLTLKITNNTVNSAVVIFKLLILKIR